MRHRLSVAVLFGLIAASCSSSSAKPIETVLPAVSTAAPTTAGAVPTTGAVTVSSPTSVATTATGSPAQTTPPTDTTPAPIAEAIADPLPCDPLDPSACLLPWPNDAFTRADASTPTGHRLAIAAQSPPKNSAGTAIDVTDQDRADGFSPGSAILVHVAGLDPGASSIAPSTDIGASLADAAPILLIDATSGERWPYWAELDATATSADTQLLMVHPAKSLTEAHRYIVVLQHLRTATAAIATSPAFTAALAGTGSEAPRAAHLQHVVDDAVAAGADRSSIYMAWDFTVSSAKIAFRTTRQGFHVGPRNHGSNNSGSLVASMMLRAPVMPGITPQTQPHGPQRVGRDDPAGMVPERWCGATSAQTECAVVP